MRFFPRLLILLLFALAPVLTVARDAATDPATLPVAGVEAAETATVDEAGTNSDLVETPGADVAVQNVRNEEKRIPFWAFVVGGAVIGGICGAVYSLVSSALGGGKKAS